MRNPGEAVFKDRFGYMCVVAPAGHPCARCKGIGNGARGGSRGYVRRSRYVMEQAIGRFLNPDEIVHHINGIKDDDRLENLELMSSADHSRLHQKSLNPRGRIGAPSGKVTCVHCSNHSHMNVKRGLCNACYLRAKRLRRKGGDWPSWACKFPTKREAGVNVSYATIVSQQHQASL